ncbi:DUF2637 domain-containing protein [Streptomyces sp. NPDC021080]|uniref:DUF2637 domain-containing protein n=1 Tax=Streptomyces sp. NPDC021080 TaxID=3365110 RepID=UPI00379DE433
MARTKRTRNNDVVSATRRPSLRERLADVDWDTRLTDILIYAIALGGFYGGFQTLYTMALKVGMPSDQAAVVSAIADLSVLAYSRKAVQEIREGRSAWGIRLIVAGFSLATFSLQIRSAWPNPTAVAFHALSPAAWIIGHEMMLRGRLRNAKAARRRAEILAGLRPAQLPSIRLSWWFLAPFSTFKVWRRVKLWELAPNVVVRQLADDYKSRGEAIPAAWESVLITPVPLPAAEEKPALEATPEPEAEENEEVVMWRCFLQALPTAPPKGRTAEQTLAYVDRVKQIAGEFGVECNDKTIAGLLDVHPSRISKIRKDLVPTGN